MCRPTRLSMQDRVCVCVCVVYRACCLCSTPRHLTGTLSHLFACCLAALQVNVKLKAENVDIAYPPIFQSGGK